MASIPINIADWVGRTPNIGSSAAEPAIKPSSEPSLGATL